jgi:hypothetical protein
MFGSFTIRRWSYINRMLNSSQFEYSVWFLVIGHWCFYVASPSHHTASTTGRAIRSKSSRQHTWATLAVGFPLLSLAEALRNSASMVERLYCIIHVFSFSRYISFETGSSGVSFQNVAETSKHDGSIWFLIIGHWILPRLAAPSSISPLCTFRSF